MRRCLRRRRLCNVFALLIFEEVFEYFVLLIVWVLMVFPDKLGLIALVLQSCNGFFVADFLGVLHQLIDHVHAFFLGFVRIAHEHLVALVVVYGLSIGADHFSVLLGLLTHAGVRISAHDARRHLKRVAMLVLWHDLELTLIHVCLVCLYVHLLLLFQRLGSLH